MLTLGKTALAIAGGGILLGTLLGSVAHPVMKRPPEPTWGHLLQGRDTADETGEAEAFIASFDPYMGPDSYAPAFAHETVHDWEPEYPSWTYSDFTEGVPAIGEEHEDLPLIEALPVSLDQPVAPQDAAPLAEAPANGLEPLY
ncbi:MAG TPA: hypothetical protein VI168_00230 [Croceibacterium sp.]